MRVKLNFFVFLFVGLMNLVDVFAMSKELNQNRVFVESLMPQGYVKDGSVDYTDIIQKILNKYNHVVFPNFPILINCVGLKVKSNSVLEFQENSLLKLKASDKHTYNILEIHSVQKVKILNVKIKGDLDTHIGKDGEHGMGISIRSSKDVEVVNAKIEDCWGDGIYIGRLNRYDRNGMFVPSENIIIRDAYLNRNRRNAISITAGRNILIDKLEANNTKGTFPMAGIDIEPNSNKDYLEGILLKNIVTNSNRYGIQLCLKKMVGERQRKVDIRIEGHKDERSHIGFRIDKFDRKGKPLNGLIEVKNTIWSNNKNGHLSFAGDQSGSCQIIFSNVLGKKNGVISNEVFRNESGKNPTLKSIQKKVVFKK